MSLLDTLKSDMIKAMKERDKETLSVVRMLKAAVQNEQIELGHDLTPDEEIGVLNREYKQRKESLAEFKKAGRDDLINKAEAEMQVVQKYLPKQLSPDEVKTKVAAIIQEQGASSMKDFGKVMGAAMKALKGQADGQLVNKTVKSLLQ